ncbi:MAG: pyrroline-5-carboxylate reductase [Verrucomicrobiota bacterium]
MKLGVIGCGKMGGALLGGIIRSGICRADETYVFDVYAPSAQSLADELGVNVADSNQAVVDASDAVLLCTKPQGFVDMLGSLGPAENRLLISIAAGIQISTIERQVESQGHRVIRVMPNTPALVGKGASGYALGTAATEGDAQFAESLLGSVGYAARVSEPDLDAVTALSGSGPAYVFLMIENLISTAVSQGLEPDVARQLAVMTVAGAAEMVAATGEDPAILRENVTSPNGTTFAALESFRENGFPRIVTEALTAARDRSIELGKS